MRGTWLKSITKLIVVRLTMAMQSILSSALYDARIRRTAKSRLSFDLNAFGGFALIDRSALAPSPSASPNVIGGAPKTGNGPKIDMNDSSLTIDLLESENSFLYNSEACCRYKVFS